MTEQEKAIEAAAKAYCAGINSGCHASDLCAGGLKGFSGDSVSIFVEKAFKSGVAWARANPAKYCDHSGVKLDDPVKVDARTHRLVSAISGELEIWKSEFYFGSSDRLVEIRRLIREFEGDHD